MICNSKSKVYETKQQPARHTKALLNFYLNQANIRNPTNCVRSTPITFSNQLAWSEIMCVRSMRSTLLSSWNADWFVLGAEGAASNWFE